MLGHEMTRTLLLAGHDLVATSRRPPAGQVRESLAGAQLLSNIDVRLDGALIPVVGDFRADAVVNCIGIVKQRPQAKEALESIRVNSLFPHELSALCRAVGARLIHVSTDCVFSGRTGNYNEDDIPDPLDLYGRSKLLGEVAGSGSLTLRTSIIGLEQSREDSLVEWFLRQDDVVPGWTRAFYSGLTTSAFSRLVARILEECPGLDGLWHVSAAPISKHDLLVLLRDALGRHVQIRPDDSVAMNRVLDSGRFRAHTGYEPPDWTLMIDELAMAVKQREEQRV